MKPPRALPTSISDFVAGSVRLRVARFALPVSILLGATTLSAQNTYYWRTQASTGNWSTDGNWYNVGLGQSSGTPAGNENINFDNSAQLSMTNDLAATSRFKINFLQGSGARTINGTTANYFFDFGGNAPQIYNNSGNTQTINFDVVNANSSGSNRLQLNADSSQYANSNLIFGGAVSASGGNRTVAVVGSGTTTISGQVTQASGAVLTLSMEGNGTLVLSNTGNNYTGGTNVSSGGTLLINGDNSAATGAASISGTLGGTGTMGGATTVNTGGTITGGTVGAVGGLTLANMLNVNGTYLADITGATSDRLTLTNGSALTLGGGSTLTINGSTDGASTYTLATYGSLSGTFGTVNNLPSNYALVYGTSELDLVPVPEPATWLGGTLVLAVAGWRLRRSKARRGIVAA